MGRITILITLLLFMAGCNLLQSKDPTEETLAYESNFEIIGKEKDSLIGHLHPDLFEPAIKGKKISEANVLFIDSKADRPYKVSTGRYEISGMGTGYVYLYDEDNELVYREYIAYGIEKVEVDIKDSYEFRFNGLERVVLAEIEPGLTEELTPGVWEVGTHIAPGSYAVTGEGFGYIKFLTNEDNHQLFEVVGSPFTESIMEMNLVEGQKVIVSGLSQVILDPLQ